MTDTLTLKQRLFLIVFTIFLGVHIKIFQMELLHSLRSFSKYDMVMDTRYFQLNEFGTAFLLKLGCSFIIGIFLVPFAFKNTLLTIRDKIIISLFSLIFLLIFANTWFLKMFAPGTIYVADVSSYLYFTPLFIIIGAYLLPKFVSASDYQPRRAFIGGLFSCLLVMPFAVIYDSIGYYEFFLSYSEDTLRNVPEENHIYYFLGFLLSGYSELDAYIGPAGRIWFIISFLASGVCAWVAHLILYHHQLKSWAQKQTVFD